MHSLGPQLEGWILQMGRIWLGVILALAWWMAGSWGLISKRAKFHTSCGCKARSPGCPLGASEKQFAWAMLGWWWGAGASVGPLSATMPGKPAWPHRCPPGQPWPMVVCCCGAPWGGHCALNCFCQAPQALKRIKQIRSDHFQPNDPNVRFDSRLGPLGP